MALFMYFQEHGYGNDVRNAVRGAHIVTVQSIDLNNKKKAKGGNKEKRLELNYDST